MDVENRRTLWRIWVPSGLAAVLGVFSLGFSLGVAIAGRPRIPVSTDWAPKGGPCAACIAAQRNADLAVEAEEYSQRHGAMVEASPRSGRWPAVRADHLAKHPTCAACGCKQDLQVHHIQPFHDRPDLELDPDNLVTLCNYHGCHLAFGHLYDFRRSNPNVREDAARWRKKVEEAAKE